MFRIGGTKPNPAQVVFYNPAEFPFPALLLFA